MIILSFDNDSEGFWPSTCLMWKLAVEFYRCLGYFVELFCFCHDASGFFYDGIIRLKADYILDFMFFTIVIHMRWTIVVITSYDNTHFRPGFSDSRNDTFHNWEDFFSRRSFARPENSGDQLAAFTFVNVYRHVAEAIVISIEKRQLLITISCVSSIVNIYDDAFGCIVIWLSKSI